MPRAGNRRAREVCSHSRGLPTCRGGEGELLSCVHAPCPAHSTISAAFFVFWACRPLGLTF